MCIRQIGHERQLRASARRRLLALGAGEADRPWVTLVFAHLLLDELRRREAMTSYEQAAEAFARTREAEGEVIARQNLASQFRLLGDVEAAARHVARAVVAANESGEPLTIARATVLEAVHAMSTGGDIGRAQQALARADRLTPSTAPIGLRRTILFNLANANLYMGRAEDAIDALDRHRALRAEDHSTQNAATVELNRLVAQTIIEGRQPSANARVRLIADAEAVVQEAGRLRDPLVQAQTQKLLADLVAATEPRRAVRHLERCLELEAPLHLPRVRTPCLWSLAHLASTHDPQRAEQLSQQAFSLIDGSQDGLLLAFAWQARLRLVWRALPTDAAIHESLNAIEAIERLRLAQQDDRGRAAVFSRWVPDYQWLMGRLLQLKPARVPHAFDVGERMRGRMLVEQLAAHGGPKSDRSSVEPVEAHLLRRIADTQRRLVAPALGASERHMLSSQLELLELERAALTRGRPLALPTTTVAWASLDSVQRALGEDEAMMWFSKAPWTDLYGEFGGGSWALTITRRRVSVHRLPLADSFEDQVSALVGLGHDRHVTIQMWTRAARPIARALMDDAAAELPSSIRRLILVPDGSFHRLPIEALPLRSGELIGERFEVSLAPSATVWLRSRRSPVTQPATSVLLVADPRTPSGSPDGDRRLGPLPEARREADAIARLLGRGASRVVTGSAASEAFVKRAPLSSFSMVHFATHAWVDAVQPERSAVFLTPGGNHEDGWLQPHEIANLDFGGLLVVLSSCDAADGSVVAGEGPLSLARAFFAANASAVLANRWPLRDDDAAHVMVRFYRALAAGSTAGEALRVARREARRAGLPPSAWAGVTLLGDGDRRPLHPGVGRTMLVWGVPDSWTPVAAIGCAIGGALWLRRRRSRSR